MKVLVVYSRLYGQALMDALHSIRKNAWTLLWPMGFMLATAILGMVVGSLNLGIIGGFILYLGTVALVSGYLYFLSELVQKSRVSFHELKKSLGAYFSPVLSVGFVLFIFRILLVMLLRNVPSGNTLYAIIQLLMVVLLSAAPEVIYQRHPVGGIATIKSAIEFLQANWLEWIVPNIPLFAAGYLLFYVGGGLPLPVELALYAVAGAVLHVAFVFRGFVFKALDRSSHRQRMFNYRNG
jgi:hypothetical protein